MTPTRFPIVRARPATRHLHIVARLKTAYFSALLDSEGYYTCFPLGSQEKIPGFFLKFSISTLSAPAAGKTGAYREEEPGAEGRKGAPSASKGVKCPAKPRRNSPAILDGRAVRAARYRPMVCLTEAAALSTASVTACMALPAAVRRPWAVRSAISAAAPATTPRTMPFTNPFIVPFLLSDRASMARPGEK